MKMVSIVGTRPNFTKEYVINHIYRQRGVEDLQRLESCRPILHIYENNVRPALDEPARGIGEHDLARLRHCSRHQG